MKNVRVLGKWGKMICLWSILGLSLCLSAIGFDYVTEGTQADSEVAVTINGDTVTLDFTLNNGWNLMFIPSNMSVTSTFTNVFPEGTNGWAWVDGEKSDQQVTEFTSGSGFWIEWNGAPTTVHIQGTFIDNNKINFADA